MDKTKINGYMLVLAAAAALMGACTDEYEYTPGTVGNQGAYINASNTTIVLAPEDVQQLSFTVGRHDSIEAATYKLYASKDGYNVPSEVSFNAGEREKTVTIDFDIPVGTYGDSLTIGIDDADAYMYGAHSQTFVISRCKKIEGCMLYNQMFYSQGHVGTMWEVNVIEYGTTTQKNADGTEETVAKYMIRDPYAAAEGVNGLTNEDVTGYNISFELNSTTNVATLTPTTQTVFYASSVFTGDPTVTGDITVSGNGTYYKDMQEIESGVEVGNFVMFNWTMLIGDTGYGYGTKVHALIFPENYDPLTQTETE